MQISQGHYGWTASSDITLYGDRVVRVTTLKTPEGKLETTARCCRKINDQVDFSVAPAYYRTLIVSDVDRVTLQALEEQHKLVDLKEVEGMARAFLGLPVA